MLERILQWHQANEYDQKEASAEHACRVSKREAESRRERG
jgi:hypothetical protein